MNNFKINHNIIPKIEELTEIYTDVGWYTYSKDLNKLEKAFKNSFLVITVWDDNILIGLLRAVGDGETIMYIQDILVSPKYQGQGIGRRLMNEFINKYDHVRQKVVLTDNQENTIKFYESCGFFNCTIYNNISFVNYNIK